MSKDMNMNHNNPHLSPKKTIPKIYGNPLPDQ